MTEFAISAFLSGLFFSWVAPNVVPKSFQQTCQQHGISKENMTGEDAKKILASAKLAYAGAFTIATGGGWLMLLAIKLAVQFFRG